jgi:hypothetical protein
LLLLLAGCIQHTAFSCRPCVCCVVDSGGGGVSPVLGWMMMMMMMVGGGGGLVMMMLLSAQYPFLPFGHAQNETMMQSRTRYFSSSWWSQIHY